MGAALGPVFLQVAGQIPVSCIGFQDRKTNQENKQTDVGAMRSDEILEKGKSRRVEGRGHVGKESPSKGTEETRSRRTAGTVTPEPGPRAQRARPTEAGPQAPLARVGVVKSDRVLQRLSILRGTVSLYP